MAFFSGRTVGWWASLISVLACNSGCGAEFRQRSCEIDSDSVALGLVRSDEIQLPHAHRYYVKFDRWGMTVNLPPVAFAPPWADVGSLVYSPGTGLLDLGELRNGNERKRHLGFVTRSCWDAIQHVVRASKVPVRLEEAAGE